MPNVVFVAPFLLETTLRFIAAAAEIPGVRLGLVTQDPPDRVPAILARKLSVLEQAEDALSAESILAEVRKISEVIGPVDRLLGALEELQVPLGEVRETLRIPGMGGSTALNFRDKARMKDVLDEAGLPCARHARVSSADEVWRFARTVGYPLILKPTAGSGSRATFRVQDETQLREVLESDEPSAEATSIAEEFVTGEEHSFDSVCLGGQLQWYSTTDYFPGPLQVLENPWIQWAVVLPRERRRPDVDGFVPIAQAALRALGMVNGFSHMEWFRRPDGRYAISEVGARPPGAQFVRLISWAHDVDMERAWAQLMIFDEFDPPARPYAAGAAYLRGQGTGRVKAVRGLREVRDLVGTLAVEVKLPKEGQPATGTYDGDGYVIVRHPDTAVVRKALAVLVRTVKVELE